MSVCWAFACSSSGRSLQSDLESDLKPGLPVEAIHTILCDHAVDYDEIEPASRFSALWDQVPPDTPVIAAGKHFDNGDFLQVLIVLDKDLRLVKVVSSLKGPVL